MPRKYVRLKDVATKRQMKLLGKITDQEFADMTGMAQSAVCNLRNRLGIKALWPNKGKNKNRKGRIDFSAIVKHLGNVGDGTLADRINCSRERVRTLRVKLGIAPYSPLTAKKTDRSSARRKAR